MRPGDTQNLTVVLRVRPLCDAQLGGKDRIVHVLDGQMVILTDPRDEGDVLRANRSREKRYMFDIAFDSYNTQLDVYLATTKPLIDSVLDGFNATVFAYGPTGTGKTYTMLGTDDDPGIMALALNEMFAMMRKGGENSTFNVTMSYLEVYNELIRDLLCPDSGDLELREDTSGVTVAGLSEVEATSTKEVMDMLRDGNKRRTTEPTSVNKTSSRSHAVLQVTVRRLKRQRALTETVHTGRLYMIDLAGSERATHTKNRGTRLVEGAHINRSLLALGNCIKALSNNGSTYVNYRDSKLTRLLKDSLGGNCRTVMIAHVSPDWRVFDESRNTLQYADRAKRIKTKVRPNLQTVSHHIAKYPIIVEELHKEIERLKKKIEDNQSIDSVSSAMILNKDREQLEATRTELNKLYTHQLKLKKKLAKIENNKKVGRIKVDHLSSLLNQYSTDLGKYKVVPPIEPPTDPNHEPTQVSDLRRTLSRMSAGRRRQANAHTNIQTSWDKIVDKYRSVEEEIEDKISDEDHREILCMLTNVHSLEIELAGHTEEISALHHIGEEQQVWLEAQRNINADLLSIVNQQQGLLSSHNVEITPELDKLYKKLQERCLEQYSILPRINSAVSSTGAAEVLNELVREEQEPQNTEHTPMFMKTYNVIRDDSQKNITPDNRLMTVPKVERDTSQTTIHILSTPSLTEHHTPPRTSSIKTFDVEGPEETIITQSSMEHVTPSATSIPPHKQAKKAIQLQRLRALHREPIPNDTPSKISRIPHPPTHHPVQPPVHPRRIPSHLKSEIRKKPWFMKNIKHTEFNKTYSVPDARSKIADKFKIYGGGSNSRTPNSRIPKKNSNVRKHTAANLVITGTNKNARAIPTSKVFR